jgi:hypothetical protein
LIIQLTILPFLNSPKSTYEGEHEIPSFPVRWKRRAAYFSHPHSDLGVFFKKPKLSCHEAKSQRADLQVAGACQVRFAAFADRKVPRHEMIFSLLNLILHMDRV